MDRVNYLTTLLFQKLKSGSSDGQDSDRQIVRTIKGGPPLQDGTVVVSWETFFLKVAGTLQNSTFKQQDGNLVCIHTVRRVGKSVIVELVTEKRPWYCLGKRQCLIERMGKARPMLCNRNGRTTQVFIPGVNLWVTPPSPSDN